MAQIVIALVFLLGCGSGAPPTTRAETGSREVANLRAFARLYGVVRWFHPSDEAAEVDWNAFAVRGVTAVRGAASPKALAEALDGLVRPIGPSIVIGTAAEVTKASATPRAPAGAKVDLVAWQYVGPGFDGGGGPYQAKRTARVGSVRAEGSWGAFSQAVIAAPLRGRRVRLRARLRAGKNSQVGAWLRVDRPAGGLGFFDNMMDRAITTASWQRGTIEGDVENDAERVVVGGLVQGDEGWFDDFVLEVADGQGGWSSVALANGDFESGATAWQVGIGKSQSPSFDFSIDAGAAHLRSPRQPLTVDLFPERPEEGEAVIVDLGDGQQARVPIALTSVDGHTVPRATQVVPPSLDTETASVKTIADVIVVWNVFAHFYPYLDVIKTDWHAYLDDALTAAIAAGDDADAGRTAVRRVIVAAEDGHGSMTNDGIGTPLPMVLDLVEGKVVVVVSADAAVKPGDEIVTIDGVTAAVALDAERARHSGSPQWRSELALSLLGSGPDGSTAALKLRRGGAPDTSVTTVKRGTPPSLYTYPPVGEVEPGIWLIDLGRAEMADINAKMEMLAAARGIVFDLRGYPNNTDEVLNHLLGAPEHDRWMHMAHVIRPNLPGQLLPRPEWTSIGWDKESVAPRFRGKVVFLTGPGAISYAESVMGYVEALGLPIVGGATAGTNGNVRRVTLPSGRSFTFTGMKVTRHDGTRSHLIGIRPTVPVERTLAGVRAGSDEVLERGLALVR